MRLQKIIILIPYLLMNIIIDNGAQGQAIETCMRKPLFTFGVIADVQYADAEPAGTRYYRSSLTKLKEALSDFRNDSVDFVITLGDLIDRDYISFKKIFGILDSSGLKLCHIAGNHDYTINQKHGNDLPSFYSTKKGYYSFEHKNFRFIFLNGNEISLYSSKNARTVQKAKILLDSLKMEGKENALEWNGGIGADQLHWLDNQLYEASAKNEKVFIACHFPVFPENIHNLLNYKEVLDILQKYTNIVAWFNGHNHSGNYGYTGQIHFITFKGMVETRDQNSFARIEVYNDRILIIGSGRETSRELLYR